MAFTKGSLLQPQGLSTVERDLLTLAGADVGRLIYNETTNRLQQWDGSAWVDLFFTDDTLPFVQITGQAVTAQLTDSSVTDAKIASVDGSKLIDGTVTNSKVVSLSGSKLTGDVDGGIF